MGIYSYIHLFNYLLGSCHGPDSVLSAEEIVGSKSQAPFLYLWSWAQSGVTYINIFITHIKFTRTTESPRCALGSPGSAPGEERQEWLWGREEWGSPGPSEAGGREHQRVLPITSKVALSSGKLLPEYLNCGCRLPGGAAVAP